MENDSCQWLLGYALLVLFESVWDIPHERIWISVYPLWSPTSEHIWRSHRRLSSGSANRDDPLRYNLGPMFLKHLTRVFPRNDKSRITGFLSGQLSHSSLGAMRSNFSAEKDCGLQAAGDELCLSTSFEHETLGIFARQLGLRRRRLHKPSTIPRWSSAFCASRRSCWSRLRFFLVKSSLLLVLPQFLLMTNS